MENLKKPCTDPKLRTLLNQIFVSWLYSLFVMSITVSLLIFAIEKDCDKQNNFSAIHHIVIAFLIVFVFNNMNILFVQIIHYFNIFPFFLYSRQCIVIETILFSLLTYITLFLDIDIPVTVVNTIIVLFLPEMVMVILILLFKYCCKRKYRLLEEKYTIHFNSINDNQKYSYSRTVDTALGVIIPSATILVSLTFLFK